MIDFAPPDEPTPLELLRALNAMNDNIVLINEALHEATKAFKTIDERLTRLETTE